LIGFARQHSGDTVRAFFSEFSYGFAVTYEIAEAFHDVIPAPRFPSLLQEGQLGGGFDVNLDTPGMPLFLQFKVSEHMKRPTAKEWQHFGQEYYRFKLHARRHSNQHQMLLDLETQGNLVYYAAPAFHRAEDLNTAFRDRHVFDRTVFVRPMDLGQLPDDEEHCVAFLPGDYTGRMYSEPRTVRIAAEGKAFREDLNRQRERLTSRQINAEFLLQLAADMEGIARKRLKFAVGGRARETTADLTPMERVGYLSRTFFDAEFFVFRT
jgi:hypothetical protein